MSEEFQHRVMKGSDLTPTEADELFAPPFTQAAHGFAVGDVVRRSSATAHAKAQADTDANIGVGLSLVVHVPDANTFSALRASNSHAVTLTAHGFGSFGANLYLSRTVAGALTATGVAGWRIYLGYVIDANTIHWERDWVRF